MMKKFMSVPTHDEEDQTDVNVNVDDDDNNYEAQHEVVEDTVHQNCHRMFYWLFRALFVACFCTPLMLTAIRFEQQSSTTTPTTPTPTIYYSTARRDRSGAAIGDMLKAHNFCFEQGWIYGGACGSTAYQSVNEELLAAVGLDDVLTYSCPRNKQDVIMNSTWYHKHDFNATYMDFLATHVQQRAQMDPSLPFWECEQTTRQDKTFRVAVHIRRGDISLCREKYANRYIPNYYYLQLIDQVLQSRPSGMPHYQVDIFSQSNTPDNTRGAPGPFEDFDEFVDRGYHLHLDSPLPQVWKSIIEAEATIISHSSFSQVPALLKFSHSGLVLYPSGDIIRLHAPDFLGNWIVANKTLLETSAQVLAQMRKELCAPGSFP